jgi:hypothetical protein
VTSRRDTQFEFTWLDAYCPEDQWYDREDFVLDKRVMVTVGWVLAQDREYMAVAGTYDQEAGKYTQVISIPRGCIVKIREVVGGQSSGSDFDPGDSGRDDPADSEGPEAGRVLSVLVGVPDPGGSELGRAPEEVARPVEHCVCPCHRVGFGAMNYHHVTSCCDFSGRPLDSALLI